MSDQFELRDQPYVIVTLRAYRGGEPTDDGSRGVSTVRFSRMAAEEGGEEIGSVAAGIGYIVISDSRRDPSYEQEYLIPLEDVWSAFQEAIEDNNM